jgi:hypothetical protein
MMVVILLNSITIAAFDSSLQHQRANFVTQQVGQVFTAIYLLEAIMKTIANGFLIGQNTYLRDPLNIFDFAVVVSALLEVILTRKGSSAKLLYLFRVLRSLRVLKLLAGFYKNNEMRQ